MKSNRLGKPFQMPEKVAPIEFVMIVVLVAVHMQSMSLTQLSEAIGAMRRDVRVQHVDIRLNNRVAKSLLTFVKDLGQEPRLEREDSTGAAVKKKRKREKERSGSVGTADVSETTSVKSRTPSIPSASAPAASTLVPPPINRSHSKAAALDRLQAIHHAKKALPPEMSPIGSTPSSTVQQLSWLSQQQQQQQQVNRSLEEMLIAKFNASGGGAARVGDVGQLHAGGRPPDPGIGGAGVAK